MNSRSSDEMNDQDIARVFDAHDIDVPAALDEKILNAARHSGLTQSGALNSHVYRRNNWYVHGFAIAATVMLTVAIAPLLLQSPDTSGHSKLSESEVALMAPTATLDVVATTGVPIEPAPLDFSDDNIELAAHIEVSSAEESELTDDVVIADAAVARDVTSGRTGLNAELRPDANTRSIEGASAARDSSRHAPVTIAQKSISGGSAGADPELLETDQDRAKAIGGIVALGRMASYNPDKPDSWLEAIKTLATKNETEMARQEFDKFRARYPDYQTDFHLDEFLHTLKTQQKATD